jgi:hypothetical protein
MAYFFCFGNNKSEREREAEQCQVRRRKLQKRMKNTLNILRQHHGMELICAEHL